MKYSLVFLLLSSAIFSSLSHASDDDVGSTAESDADTIKNTTADVAIVSSETKAGDAEPKALNSQPKTGNVVSNFTVNKSPANVICYANPAGAASGVGVTNAGVNNTGAISTSTSQNGNNGLNTTVNNNGVGQMIYVPVRVPKGMAQQVLSANPLSAAQNGNQVYAAFPNAVPQSVMQQPAYGMAGAVPTMPGMGYPGVMPPVSGMSGYAGIPGGMPMMTGAGMMGYPGGFQGGYGTMSQGGYGASPYSDGSAYSTVHDRESSFEDRIKNKFSTDSNTESSDSSQNTPDKYEDGNGYVCKRKKPAFSERMKNFFGMGKKDNTQKKNSDNQRDQESDNQNMIQNDQQKPPAKPGAVSRLKNFFGMGKK